jgi:NAD(P)-dependent dehydrogenase (short-subunit alcohol dehydrogenase family)
MKVSELFDVKDLATIVTGGASGIGLAYAEAMADNRARVALLDIDDAGLDRAVAKLKAKGGDIRGIVVDVTDRPGLRAAIDDAAGAFGRLDVLFANAGIDPGPAFISATGERMAEYAFENVSDERWDKIIATNLSSVFTSIRAAVPHMKKNRAGGRIIVTTSIAGIKPEAIVGMPYMPAKAGAAHFAKRRSNWRNTTFWSTPSLRVRLSPTLPVGTCRSPKCARPSKAGFHSAGPQKLKRSRGRRCFWRRRLRST